METQEKKSVEEHSNWDLCWGVLHGNLLPVKALVEPCDKDRFCRAREQSSKP